MADAPKFRPYTTVQGDRLDIIARKAYGDENKVADIMRDNPNIVLDYVLRPGLPMWLRIIVDPTTGAELPPWKTDSEDQGDGNVIVDPTIPIITVPDYPLSFSAGYPKIVDNKIEFAINKNGKFPYSIELVGRGVVDNSSLYDFTSGFPVSSIVLTEDGLYVVRVGSLVSEQLTASGLNPLSWQVTPVIVEQAPFWAVKHTLNKTGKYTTTLKNKSTGSIVSSSDIIYTKGEEVFYPVLAAGSYTFTVGSISFDFVIQTIVESADWLLRLGYTHNPLSREFTEYARATEPVEFRLSAPSGSQPSGVSSGGLVWNDTTYMPQVVDEYLGAFTGKRGFNPVTVGSGTDGVGIGAYYMWVRRVSNPTVVVRKLINTDAFNHSFPPVDVPLGSTNPDLPSCSLNGGRPPTFFGALASVEANKITFTFDAEKVPRLYVRIKSGSSLVRQSELVYYKNATAADEAASAADVPTPTIQIISGNTVTFKFATLSAGGYTIEIEGSSCKSDVSVKPFTIADSPLIFGSGYPFYVQNGGVYSLSIKVNKADTFLTRVVKNSDNTEVFNGNFNYQNDAVKVLSGLSAGTYTVYVGSISTTVTISPPAVAGDYVPQVLTHCMPETMNIVITGSSENWILNDTADIPLESEAEVVCFVAGKVVYRGKGKMTNIPYQSNNPVRIVKGKIRIGISNEVPWDDFNEQNYFTQPWNQSCSTTLIHFKPV